MDLCAVEPIFNLYNDKWPILTSVPSLPPAKFVHEAGTGSGGRSTAWSAPAW
jgi:ADP-glucose pyrophosphorylase